jgi:hypothetical protein
MPSRQSPVSEVLGGGHAVPGAVDQAGDMAGAKTRGGKGHVGLEEGMGGWGEVTVVGPWRGSIW